MRRLGVVLLAVLAVWLLPAAAAHARVAQKSVREDPAAVERFWTAERMRSATPVELVQRTGAAPSAAASPTGAAVGDAVQVPPPYTSAPTRTHGKVFFTDGGARYVCSGTALLSGNESTVWTAGHCVHDGTGGFHANWVFVPAYADGTAPYGEWAARTLLTTRSWSASGDLSYDLGAAVVGANGSGTRLTDVIGGRDIAFNAPRNQRYQAHGYPAGWPFDGQRLWICDAAPTRSDPSTSPRTMGIPCDMTGGSSGGGWIAGSAVHSVNSYGYRTLPDVMFGPYQGDVARSLYTQAGGS
jgi:V8-like Glu-specific endopeptidase